MHVLVLITHDATNLFQSGCNVGIFAMKYILSKGLAACTAFKSSTHSQQVVYVLLQLSINLQEDYLHQLT